MTSQTQVRLSDEGRFFLKTCTKETGFNQTKVIEVCLALHALQLGREVQRAHEFLYSNLVRLQKEQLEVRRHLKFLA